MTYKITITGIHTHTSPTCENNVVLLQCMHLSPLCESACVRACVRSFCASLFQSADNSLCVCFLMQPFASCAEAQFCPPF